MSDDKDFVEWHRVDDVDSGRVGVDKAKMYRLRKWQDNVSGGKFSRNFEFAVSLIDRYVGALGVPKCVRADAVDVYGASVTEGLLRGRRVEVLVAVSIYVGCRLCRVAYSVDEIVECVGVGKKEVVKLFKVVRDGLELDLPLVRPIDYVVRYRKVLGLSDESFSECVRILDSASESGVANGRSPLGLVGGAVYLACLECGERKSQRDIGDVLGVSEVTLRKRCSELEGL